MKVEMTAPSAVSTCRALQDGRSTAVRIAEQAIERIVSMEPRIHAWQIFDPEAALVQARRLDERSAAGQMLGQIAGVPLGVKDIFDTVDLPTAYGSPIYQGARPAADARAVATMRAAGAVVMGKTVTTEFAYFTPGPTTNPWNPRHTPGGSSSGSAAAVASGMVPLAFGSQTAGSLIRPASYCGVFGIKPTYGAVGLQGVKPFSPSLDTMGWLARDADDLELMRCVLMGEDYRALDVPALPVLKLAASTTHESFLLEQGGQHGWQLGMSKLAIAGARPAALTMPQALAGLFEAQKVVMAWEAARSLERETREHRHQLSAPILTLIETGLQLSEAKYRDAQALAAEGRRQMASLMQGLDALIVPAAPGEAPMGLEVTGDPAFSRVWTLLGLPCVSVPGLVGPAGLPVGLQLVGHPHQERRLLSVAASLHEALTR